MSDKSFAERDQEKKIAALEAASKVLQAVPGTQAAMASSVTRMADKFYEWLSN